MFQLHLDFLGRQLERLQPGRSPRTEQDQTWIWKHGITVHLVRPSRARRYLLRLQPDGSARLVVPRRGSRAEGIRLLERSEPWLLKQLSNWQKRSAERQPWNEGTQFLFHGEKVVLSVKNSDDGNQLRFSNQIISVSNAQADYRKVVLDHLRKIAERELPRRTRELAQHHGIAINRVTVRAQKTRWGSCSARGTISLNWRLVQAPASVSDYLIIHELMHRREMNHSTRYWKLVAEACPNYDLAEQWLKKFRLNEDY